MSTKSIKLGDDVDAAMSFLGRQQRPQVSGDEFFMAKVQSDVIDAALRAADEMRFNLVKELLNDEKKGESISKLRELLGV